MEKAADQVVCLTKGDAKEYKHTKKIRGAGGAGYKKIRNTITK